MTMSPLPGTFPFGAKLVPLVQADRSPKRVFVLGVYASAVHARWTGPDGRVLVHALAVASEPVIFWNGDGAADIIRAIPVPAAAGRLEPADAKFNGPSGRSIDDDFLGPLGLARADAWLCDLVPHTCLNPSQRAAAEREYEPRREACGLPPVDLPDVPKSFADDERRAEILSEIAEAKPSIIVLLGDQPLRHFAARAGGEWRRLADFGRDDDKYGRLHPMEIDGRSYELLPLAHPRQVSGLGMHSAEWRRRHNAWKRDVALRLL